MDSMAPLRDHGGALDRAIAEYGGERRDWVDLSTGINPAAYPLPPLNADAWTRLPEAAQFAALEAAARSFWKVPAGASVMAAAGASALIARIPSVLRGTRVLIEPPTYNEHGAAFRAAGWSVVDADEADRAHVQVVVHPNNPDGRLWDQTELTGPIRIIDESFCDTRPEASLVGLADQPSTLILKSFGKFWGLGGLRLGFVIGDPKLIAALSDAIGPWGVSGPALTIGTAALLDEPWARAMREQLAGMARDLDIVMRRGDARPIGGTSLFRLYEVADAAELADRLARAHVLVRTFPYSDTWVRIGLPPEGRWSQLAEAL